MTGVWIVLLLMFASGIVLYVVGSRIDRRIGDLSSATLIGIILIGFAVLGGCVYVMNPGGGGKAHYQRR